VELEAPTIRPHRYLTCLRVDMPHSFTYFIYLASYGVNLVWCGSKNGYQKGMCLKEIGLCVQKMITIVSSLVNTIERDLYDHLMGTKIFALMMNEIFIQILKIMKWLWTQLYIVNCLILRACLH
jgi:hypothetical protein